eukprot:TRINITY_DN469_c2_g1_i1.p1 TRINITY_DN469_c2_g1~~TRINITY_DN469_c2_g1_i1.p1  ORF type:complete len:199 (+),score=24.55 TRINITY_DN469_c2_g1_i1:204-800(+)
MSSFVCRPLSRSAVSRPLFRPSRVALINPQPTQQQFSQQGQDDGIRTYRDTLKSNFSNPGSFRLADAERFGRIPMFNRRVHVWDGTCYDPANPMYVYTTRPEIRGSYRQMDMQDRYFMFAFMLFVLFFTFKMAAIQDADQWRGFWHGFTMEEAYRRRRNRLEWQERELLLDWPDEDAEDFPVPMSPAPQMAGMATLTD